MRWRALRVSSCADKAEHRSRRDGIADFETRSVRIEVCVVINTAARADHRNGLATEIILTDLVDVSRGG
jgi:hypothetical protein